MAHPEQQQHSVTAEELYDMGDVGRVELVEGEIVSMAPVGFTHGSTAINVAANLRRFVEPKGLGVLGAEVGFILRRDPDVVRAPDVAFIAAARVEEARAARGFVPFAPDLAIEVLSPGDTFVEVDAKVRDYLQAGTRLVWVVEPRARRVFVYAPGAPVHIRTADDSLDGGDVLPGLQTTVAALLA